MQVSEAEILIRPAIALAHGPAAWADLGCGNGVFTRALANLLSPDSLIYAVDAKKHYIQSPPKLAITFIQADFVHDPLPFSKLDGVMMANSLHYVKDKISLIKKIEKQLLPGAAWIIVEYEIETANPWVPYPVTFGQLFGLFQKAGFSQIQKIGQRQSVYQERTLYTALIKP